jgi:glycosyltransferase involved in cell wall biosynthesis
MKILYATYRYDPRDPDKGSSLDFEIYNALLNQGYDMQVVGPVDQTLNLLERLEFRFWRIYKKWTHKSGMKYPLTLSWKASHMLKKSVKENSPELVISIFHSFLTHPLKNCPAVWYFDTTFLGQEAFWPQYGRLALRLTVWQEKRALRNAAAVITNSEWSKSVLDHDYHEDTSKVTVFPMPSALPVTLTGMQGVWLEQPITLPVRLLIVARVFQRKGVDLAIETVAKLNAMGIPARLRVCGLSEKPDQAIPFVEFSGPYRKSDPVELAEYLAEYKQAHFLIHPARFEAAGIAPAEAAAFGTPTITNDSGGLGTSVKDGVSGVVLPSGSPPEAYAHVVADLVNDPDRYLALRRSTRRRYEEELNWEVAGRRLSEILEGVVKAHAESARTSAQRKKGL